MECASSDRINSLEDEVREVREQVNENDKNIGIIHVNIENGIKYGKWLMRKAYEGIIPNEVVWRSKAPCEQGTGTEVLPRYFDEKVTTEEFEDKQKLYINEDYVKLSTKEQLVYYEVFRKKFGKPSEVYNDKSGKQCPNCKGYVKLETKFCRICGSYPI